MAKISDAVTEPTLDDGTGRTGTRIETFWPELIAALDAELGSETNPTEVTADIIDEVVALRGSTADADTRMSAEHNADGTHILDSGTLATLITETQLLGGIGGVNLLVNDDKQVWTAGDSAAPTGFTLGGAAATVVRCGTSLADTTRKVGDFCAKLTRAGADASLTQTVLSSAAFTRAGFLPSLYAVAGKWVKCATPNAARIGIYDGVGTTYSSYHAGDGNWEFLTVTRQINVSATQLQLIEQVANTNVAAYFSAGTLMILDGDFDLGRYVPNHADIYAAIHFSFGGAVSVLARIAAFQPARMGIVRDVQLNIGTAPTVADLIVDVNTYDGAAQTSMFSTRPQIAAGAYAGSAQPDGATYARRCFTGQFGASLTAGGTITADVDQVGAGVAGADLGIEIRCLQYHDPLEKFKDYNG